MDGMEFWFVKKSSKKQTPRILTVIFVLQGNSQNIHSEMVTNPNKQHEFPHAA